MRDIKKFIKVWLLVSSRAAQAQLLTSRAGVLFLIGKVVRFLLFLIFILTILTSAKTLAGYNREQVIFFFLVFNLVDIMVQFLFRGVYQFRFRVVSGDYDLDLVKPLPSFFRPIFGWTDILDLITLIPLWGYFLWGFGKFGERPGYNIDIDNTDYRVIQIKHNYDNFTSDITLRGI